MYGTPCIFWFIREKLTIMAKRTHKVSFGPAATKYGNLNRPRSHDIIN